MEIGELADGRKNKLKAVKFVPYTPKSELAVQLGEAEEKLESLNRYRIKIVERAGQKLEDLLHFTNPWERGRLWKESLPTLQYKNI